MVMKKSRAGYSLRGSETDEVVRPKVYRVILKKVQLRVDVTRH